MNDSLAKISSIALGKPFLDNLASGLLARHEKSEPINLGNTVIILPAEEARRNLLKILTTMAKPKALLLPRMYTVSESPSFRRPHRTGDLDRILPWDLLPDRPPIPSVSRDLLLGRLIFQWRKGHYQTSSGSLHRCLKIAPTLGRLFDEFQAFQVNYLSLDQSSASDDALHWESVDKFLRIVIKQWPGILSEQIWQDPMLYDQLITKLLIQHWKQEPPKNDIIAAGFTGNLPHIANLLSFIISLPTGHMVIPSLARGLERKTWENLPEDHPQYPIKKLLVSLKVENNQVPEWFNQFGYANATPPPKPPFNFITSAFRQGEDQDGAKSGRRILSNLAMITAQNIYSEAQTISLIIKEFLTSKQGGVSLFAEDQKLIKQVTLHLRQWNLDLCNYTTSSPDPSGASSFLQLVAEMTCSAVSPVSLLSAFKHPMCTGHTSPTLFNKLRNKLELKCLRGIRPEPGFSGIIASLQNRANKDRELIAWLQRLDRASLHFCRLVKSRKVSLKSLLAAHLDFSIWLCQTEKDSATRLWESNEGRSLFLHLNTLCSTLKESFTLDGAEYSDMFRVLLHNMPNDPQDFDTACIHTYNPEQTLFSPSSLHILAGMNQTTWPSISQSDQWLSPQIRQTLNLPGKEKTKAFAGLHICQASAASKVVLTRSRIINGVQTAPAYHFAYLENVAKKVGLHEAIDESRYWHDLGQALEQKTLSIPQSRRPAPTPPVSARPRTLSATKIERWMQDPYGIFVSTILKIRPLESVDAKAGPSDYGRMVHEALQKFVQNYPTNMPPNPHQKLLDFGQASFRKVRVQPEAYAFWWPRFERLARYFIEQEGKTRRHITTTYAEITGTTTIDLVSGPFTLTTRADRINMRADGKVDIIDYKTGALPTAPKILDGSKPQLLLEALIALDNGFEEIETREVNSIITIQLSGTSITGNHRTIQSGISTKAAELLSRLTKLIESFDNEKTPYHFVPHNDFAPQHNEFEHLARMKEWLALSQKRNMEE